MGVPGKPSVAEGLRVTAGVPGGGATAVPDSEMDCGLPAALSVMKSVAWLAPTEAGAYVTAMVQLWLVGRTGEEMQLSDSLKSEALGPEIWTEERLTD